MEKNLYKLYLHEIGRFCTLTKEQEQEYGKRIAAGDEVARKELIEHNLKLVVWVAKQYMGNGISMDDLTSWGNLGLIQAVDKFDYTKNCRFSTFATFWIKQAIIKALNDCGRSIRLPAHIFLALSKMRKAIAELEAQGEAVTDAAIAKQMGGDMTAAGVGVLKGWQTSTVSLETPLGDSDNDDTIGDLVADEEEVSPVSYTNVQLDHERIIEALNTLPDRTKRIVKLRWGIAEEGDDVEYKREHTLEEIGAIIGITRERVRQIVNGALRDLKDRLSANLHRQARCQQLAAVIKVVIDN